MIICYTVPWIRHVTDVVFIFHFGMFLPSKPPNDPNKNLKKVKKKTHGDIIEMDRRTDGHTNGQKKWHIEPGVPPKNTIKNLYKGCIYFYFWKTSNYFKSFKSVKSFKFFVWCLNRRSPNQQILLEEKHGCCRFILLFSYLHGLVNF